MKRKSYSHCVFPSDHRPWHGRAAHVTSIIHALSRSPPCKPADSTCHSSHMPHTVMLLPPWSYCCPLNTRSKKNIGVSTSAFTYTGRPESKASSTGMPRPSFSVWLHLMLPLQLLLRLSSVLLHLVRNKHVRVPLEPNLECAPLTLRSVWGYHGVLHPVGGVYPVSTWWHWVQGS